jgi:hypothetical protein
MVAGKRRLQRISGLPEMRINYAGKSINPDLRRAADDCLCAGEDAKR